MPTLTFPILLLDDEPTVADVLARALSQQFPRARLDYVTNLADAIAYLSDSRARCQVGLILIDIDLEGDHTGLELVTQLRQHESCQLTPILVLSNRQQPDWIGDAYDKGINAYTIKPDTYTGWKEYADQLRVYWSETVTTPLQAKRLL